VSLQGSGSLVSIVLVTWNSAPFLPRCLEGIAAQSWSERELIAVDNASGDGSLEMIRERFPDAVCIRNDANYGFSRAVNQAIAAARGEFVLLCNPDAFLERDYAERLVEALGTAGESFGMATGKLLRGEGVAIAPTNVIDSLGIEMRRTGRHFDLRQGERDDGIPAAPFEVFGVSGAAAMYRMAFLRDVAIDGEIFDEDFHTYREDADLAWRGRVLGWRAISVPAAKGYHVRTVTPGNRRALSPAVNLHSVKNRFLLRLKNESVYLALRNAPFEIARDLIAIAAVLTVERSSLPAFPWLWKNRRRILAKRRQIQSRRRVSDRELARWFR
jgi:GT2 family glycosyltransferase